MPNFRKEVLDLKALRDTAIFKGRLGNTGWSLKKELTVHRHRQRASFPAASDCTDSGGLVAGEPGQEIGITP